MNEKFKFFMGVLMIMIVMVRGEAAAFAAPQCVLQGAPSCADSTPCKTINGTQVCLTGVTLPAGAVSSGQACWQYSSSYMCDTLQINTCAGNAQTSCPQTSAVCAQSDPTSGDCMLYTDTYSCTTAATTSTSPASSSTCQSLISQGCTYTGQHCLDNPLVAGSCADMENDYSCPTSSTASSSTICSGGQVCVGSSCYGGADAPNNALAEVATNMEIARELGAYAGSPVNMFAGFDNRCTVKLGGVLGNCCKVTTAPNQSNFSLMGAVGTTLLNQGVQSGAQDVMAQFGSKFTYDVLYQSDANGMVATLYQDVSGYLSDTVSGLAADIAGAVGGSATAAGQTEFNNLVDSTPQAPAISANPGVFDPTTVAGDAPVGQGASTLAPTAASGGVTNLGSYYGVTVGFSSDGTLVWGFCFTCLVIQLIIMEIMKWVACTPSETNLGLKRGDNLCQSIGSYCSLKIPIIGTCIENTQSYCCFNSLLALILNQQGRPQIGKGWGSAQSPDCSGFSVAQLQGLNFSAMDLSQFAAQISAATVMPNASAITAGITAQAQSTMGSTTSTPTAAQVASLANPSNPSGGQVANTTLLTPQAAALAPMACNVAWGPITTATVSLTQQADQTATLSVSGCQPTANILWTYSGSCSALQGGGESAFNMATDSTGAGAVPLTVPAGCVASNINKWTGAVQVGTIPVQTINSPVF